MSPSVTAASFSDGTQVLTAYLDFSASIEQSINLAANLQGRSLSVLSVYCDLSLSDSDIVVQCQAAGASPGFAVKGRSVGYYPCYFPAPATVSFTYHGAAQYNPVLIQLISRRVNGPIWQAYGIV